MSNQTGRYYDSNTGTCIGYLPQSIVINGISKYSSKMNDSELESSGYYKLPDIPKYDSRFYNAVEDIDVINGKLEYLLNIMPKKRSHLYNIGRISINKCRDNAIKDISVVLDDIEYKLTFNELKYYMSILDNETTTISSTSNNILTKNIVDSVYSHTVRQLREVETEYYKIISKLDECESSDDIIKFIDTIDSILMCKDYDV